MNIIELFEGTTPKLPGAVGGIKVMSMDQFLAQADDLPDEQLDELSPQTLASYVRKSNTDARDRLKQDPKNQFKKAEKRAAGIGQAIGKIRSTMEPATKQQGLSEFLDPQAVAQDPGLEREKDVDVIFFGRMPQDFTAETAWKALEAVLPREYPVGSERAQYKIAEVGNNGGAVVTTKPLSIAQKLVKTFQTYGIKCTINKSGLKEADMNRRGFLKGAAATTAGLAGCATPSRDTNSDVSKLTGDDVRQRMLRNNDVEELAEVIYNKMVARQRNPSPAMKEGFRTMAEMKAKAIVYKYPPGEFQKAKKHEYQQLGLNEATKLPAQTRELKGQELDDYLDRIRNREKGKTDKYKLPYIHRSSVVKYYNEEGKRYDTDQIKTALGVRPKKLLKQNEKMKHSNGELEQFYNIGFAALVGIALDEGTNELIVVNTCPGAGSCKVDCFAMKGGKVQFEGPWLSDGRILTFLLNDPDGFFNQLSNEITKEEKLAQKGGYNLTIRWHDAGDFFSPEYMDMAFKLADAHPDVKFYAYTKIADAALGQKPANFIVNWSEGASTSQEKQVKAQDPQLDVTKNSRIVPSKLFYDLLKKDSDGKLDKTADGAWQPRDAAALEELKDRLAQQYNLKRDSIIDYNEMMATPQKNNIKKWNVIIAPGEGDISANRQDVLSTLLLKH